MKKRSDSNNLISLFNTFGKFILILSISETLSLLIYFEALKNVLSYRSKFRLLTSHGMP